MVSLSVEETRSFVERLIIVGKGDPGRLKHILTLLREGRRLFQSDEKYLDVKLAQELGIIQKPKRDESLIDRIQRLLDAGRGDAGRLKFILEVLRHGRPLYRSDQIYLEKKFGEKFTMDKSEFHKNVRGFEFEHLHDERFSEVVTKLADLEYQTALGNQKMTSVETSVTQTNTKFAYLESALTQTNDKFSSLESAIADTSDKVTSIESSITQTNTKFASLESALTQTSDKFSSLASAITDTNEKVSLMGSTISLTYTKISTLGSDLSFIKNKISSLELKTATAMSGLSSSLNQVSNLEIKLSQINDELSKFTTSLSANNEKIASLETRIFQTAEKTENLKSDTKDEKPKDGYCKNCGKKVHKKSSQFCSTECAIQHINKQDNE